MSKFLSKNIFKLRSDLKMTQEKLSEEAGVSYQTIFRAESKGTMPRGDNLAKIAKALGVSESDLLKDPNAEIPRKIADNASKAELIGRITVSLSTLQENELRTTLDLIEEFHRLRASVQKNEVG